MAGEELKNAAGLLADYPDNLSGLIEPVNTRNHVISAGNDVAFVEEVFAPPAVVAPTLVIADTIVNPIWVTPSTAFRFWELDGNDALIQNWGTVITNVGSFRIVSLTFDFLIQRAAPILPLTFGGSYAYVPGGAGAPGAGVINAVDNVTMRISYTDDDANDLTAELQSLGVRDVINVNGVLYAIDAFTQNAGDLEVTHDPIANQANPNPDVYFTQGLARASDIYLFQIFVNGVALSGISPVAIGDTASYYAIRDVNLQDASLPVPYDVRVAKLEASAPDLEIFGFGATAFGVMV